MAMKLTKSAIDRLVYAKTPRNQGARTTYPQDIYWDDDLPGFGIRIYPTGKKSFVLFYRAKGRQHMMTLGPYGPITLDQARSSARKQLADIIDGGDPLTTRKHAARGEKVLDLCLTYLERHARVHKKSVRDDESRIRRHIIPAWGNHQIRSITRTDVAAMHHQIGQQAPYEANRVLALVRTMFKLARQWGYLDNNAANPAHDITMFKEKKRDRWLTPEELPRLAEAINNVTNIYARAAMWMYLLTGARKSELLNATWDTVDWHRKELCIPNTKSGRVHYVPLSGPALALLGDLPQHATNPYVFVGHKQGHHLVNIEKPWRAVRKAAGVEDVRLHDLRRTVGSWLAQAGNSLHLIGRVLNHSNQSTTAIYAQFGQDHVREALESHSHRILGAAGLKPAADVISLKTNIRLRNLSTGK